MDEYDFSAPAFHDFDTEDAAQHEEFDDTYFDPRRVSQPSLTLEQQQQAAALLKAQAAAAAPSDITEEEQDEVMDTSLVVDASDVVVVEEQEEQVIVTTTTTTVTQQVVTSQQVIVSHEDVVVSQEDVIVSEEDVVVSQEDVMVSHEDVVVSQEDVMVSHEDVVVSHDEQYAVADASMSMDTEDVAIEEIVAAVVPAPAKLAWKPIPAVAAETAVAAPEVPTAAVAAPEQDVDMAAVEPELEAVPAADAALEAVPAADAALEARPSTPVQEPVAEPVPAPVPVAATPVPTVEVPEAPAAARVTPQPGRRSSARRGSSSRPRARRPVWAQTASSAAKTRSKGRDSPAVNVETPSATTSRRASVRSASRAATPTASYLRPTRASSAKKRRASTSNTGSRRSRPNSARRASASASLRLTEPQSPTFATSSRVRGTKRMSSTSMELQRLAKERAAAKKRARKNASNVARVLSSSSSAHGMPVRSTKTLTVPHQPKLRVAARARVAEMASADATSDSSHSMNLRVTPQHRRMPVRTGPVKPVPFKFMTDARAQAKGEDAQPVQAYKSLAEQVNQFQSSVPHRFHSKPTHKNVGTPQKSDATALKLTEVVPFTLRTDAIHRAPTVKSTAELEEEEIKKGSQFKARKFSSKIANSCGDLGVPKTVPKPVTQTQPFHFHERPARKPAADAGSGGGSCDAATDGEAAPAFKAQPVNKAMLERPLFRVKTGESKLTQPQSPQLRTKARSAAHVRTDAAPEEPAPKPFKARPIMGEAPPKAVVSAKKLTEPQPFHLRSMDRHEQYTKAKERELEKQAEEERRLREFKARPVPAAVEDEAAAFKPAPAAAPLTEPAPFKLRSVAKHDEWQSEFVRQMESELQQEAEAKKFKARPLPPTTFNGGFVPHKSTKPLTDHDDLVLASDRRAEERAQFDYEVSQRLAAAEEAKRAAEEERKRAEEAEAREFRKKNMLFRARPVPQTANKPMKLARSKKPLTVPHSPQLGPKGDQENVAVA